MLKCLNYCLMYWNISIYDFYRLSPTDIASFLAKEMSRKKWSATADILRMTVGENSGKKMLWQFFSMSQSRTCADFPTILQTTVTEERKSTTNPWQQNIPFLSTMLQKEKRYVV